MNKKLLFFILITISVLVAGMLLVMLFVKRYGNVWQKADEELTPVSVQLKWLHQAQFAGMYVAKEKGFYEEEGLDVTIKEATLKTNVVDEVMSDDFDFGVNNPVNLIIARGQGKKIKALAVIYQISPYALVASKESGVTSPADFLGKRLGVSGSNAFGIVLYDFLFKKFNIPEEKIKVKGFGFDIVSYLKKNEVDVIDIYRTDQVYLLKEMGIEYTLILPEYYGYDIFDDVLTTSEIFLREHPERVRAFVQATLRGWEYVLENPNEAVDITIGYVTDEKYKEIEYQKFILGQSLRLIKPRKGDPLGKMDFIRWNRLYSITQVRELFDNEFDVRDLYTNEFIR